MVSAATRRRQIFVWTSSVVDGAETKCHEIAAAQHGVFSVAQALEAGMARHQIDWRVRRGSWHRVYKNVLLAGGSPTSWHQQLMALCLSAGPGAVASHRSAGVLWGLDGCVPGIVEMSVPGKFRRPGVVVHRLAKPCETISIRDSIPVTDATCTVLDLAAVVGDFHLEKALDSALRKGLTDLDRLSERLEMRARRGRNGIRRMRRLLEVRDPRQAPSESGLEVRFARFVRRFGLPAPVPQYEIRDRTGRFVARTDFAYPEAMVAIELQSYAHHHDRLQWEKDQARMGALSALGWALYPVTNLALASDPGSLAEGLLRVLSLRTRK